MRPARPAAAAPAGSRGRTSAGRTTAAGNRGSPQAGTGARSSREFRLQQALKARIGAQRFELRLDRRACGGEGRLPRERAFEEGDGGFGVAAPRVHRGGVVASERVVGAEAHSSLEALQRDVEQTRGARRIAELLIGRSQPCVELDQDAVAERVLGSDEKINLALKEGDGLIVASLQRRE